MNFDQAVKFWKYEYCPRGAGDQHDHQRKQLTHANIGGRRVCVAFEALQYLREH